jgi:hypothetical protein
MEMKNYKKHTLNHLSFYQKSLDIFKLSRHIASYVTNDKTILSMYSSVNRHDRYADSLVMNSLGLVPKIAETETQENPVLKLKYAQSLRYFIDCLHEDCLNLERTKINGKDFVRMLRKELILLRRMHRHYVKSLL